MYDKYMYAISLLNLTLCVTCTRRYQFPLYEFTAYRKPRKIEKRRTIQESFLEVVRCENVLLYYIVDIHTS